MSSLPVSFNDTCAWDIKDSSPFDKFMKDKFVNDAIYKEFPVSVDDYPVSTFEVGFNTIISDLYQIRSQKK
jgi:hypothetical protein